VLPMVEPGRDLVHIRLRRSMTLRISLNWPNKSNGSAGPGRFRLVNGAGYGTFGERVTRKYRRYTAAIVLL
jgi:hypothetical protein